MGPSRELGCENLIDEFRPQYKQRGTQDGTEKSRILDHVKTGQKAEKQIRAGAFAEIYSRRGSSPGVEHIKKQSNGGMGDTGEWTLQRRKKIQS